MLKRLSCWDSLPPFACSDEASFHAATCPMEWFYDYGPSLSYTVKLLQILSKSNSIMILGCRAYVKNRCKSEV